MQCVSSIIHFELDLPLLHSTTLCPLDKYSLSLSLSVYAKARKKTKTKFILLKSWYQIYTQVLSLQLGLPGLFRHCCMLISSIITSKGKLPYYIISLKFPLHLSVIYILIPCFSWKNNVRLELPAWARVLPCYIQGQEFREKHQIHIGLFLEDSLGYNFHCLSFGWIWTRDEHDS